MKKSLITFSTFALFAGAVFADDSAHKTISEGTYYNSIYASESDVASGGSSLTINGGTFNLSSNDAQQKNLYGGGKAGSTIVGDTSFIFNGGDISGWTHSFYGASAENSLVKGNSTVEINSGNIYGTDLQRSGIFGGSGAGSTVTGDVKVNINGCTITDMTVFGGGDGAIPCDAQNGTYSDYLNKADTSFVKGNVSVNIGKDATVNYVSAGGRAYNVIEGNTTLTIDGTVKSLGPNKGSIQINYGTSRVGVIKGTATAYINSSASIGDKVAVYLNGEIHGNNVNYNEDGSVASVKDASKNVAMLYIDGTTINSSVQASGDDWSNKTVVYGSSLIEAKDSTITKMRGAFGENTVVHGDTNISLSNTTVTDKIYVGSDTAAIKGNANLIVNGGSVNEIYGSYGASNAQGVVGGNLNVLLKDAAVKNVYLAGKGNALLEGDATITLTGSSTVSNVLSAGGIEVSGCAPEVKGDSVLAFGNVSDSFAGTISANITDFDKMEISNSATNVVFEKAFDVSVLQVATEAKATLASGTSFEKLVLAFGSDFSQGSEGNVDLETIFGSSTSIVLSSLQDEAGATLTVKDSSGQEWSVASKDFADNTLSFVVGSQVPEPATYAAIFGALALGFVIYRRRK